MILASLLRLPRKGPTRRPARCEGVADDAIFARTGHEAGSIAEEFQRCGIYFDSAEKGDRVTGWTKMKRLLA